MFSVYCCLWVLASLDLNLSWEMNLGDHEIFEPRPCVTFDDGSMVVANRTSLLYLNSDRSLMLRAGSQGQGPGEFQSIHRVMFDLSSGYAVVTDHGNRRLSVWSQQGKLIEEMRFPADMVFEFSLVDGAIYGLRDLAGHFEGHPQLVRYQSDGSQVPVWGYPLGQAMPVTGATLDDGTEIAFLVAWDPRLVYAVGDGFAVVNWPQQNSIHLVDLASRREAAIFSCDMPRYPVTDADVRRQVDRFDPSYRSALVGKMVRAEFWPSLSSLIVDDQQRIWAFSYRRTETDPYNFVVFNREGKELGRGAVAEVPTQILKVSLLIAVERDDEI